MKKHIIHNLGPKDRLARVVGGLALLYLATLPGNVTPDFCLLVGAVAVVTGTLGSCPLYAALRLSTQPRRSASAGPRRSDS